MGAGTGEALAPGRAHLQGEVLQLRLQPPLVLLQAAALLFQLLHLHPVGRGRDTTALAGRGHERGPKFCSQIHIREIMVSMEDVKGPVEAQAEAGGYHGLCSNGEALMGRKFRGQRRDRWSPRERRRHDEK